MTKIASVSRLVMVLLVTAWGGGAMAATATNAWSVILSAQSKALPLLDAGQYRAAASQYHTLRSRTRDKDVKAYARYAYDLCQLRDKIAKGRPGQVLLTFDFDDGAIPASFRDGRERLTWESEKTFAGSPGALRCFRATADGFLLAETYTAFTVQPNALLTVCFYAHDITEAKFQPNTPAGNVHYFSNEPIEQDAWNVMTVRLGLDGSIPLPLDTPVHSVAFVAQVGGPDGFVVLDEWHAMAHP